MKGDERVTSKFTNWEAMLPKASVFALNSALGVSEKIANGAVDQDWVYTTSQIVTGR